MAGGCYKVIAVIADQLSGTDDMSASRFACQGTNRAHMAKNVKTTKTSTWQLRKSPHVGADFPLLRKGITHLHNLGHITYDLHRGLLPAVMIRRLMHVILGRFCNSKVV